MNYQIWNRAYRTSPIAHSIHKINIRFLLWMHKDVSLIFFRRVRKRGVESEKKKSWWSFTKAELIFSLMSFSDVRKILTHFIIKTKNFARKEAKQKSTQNSEFKTHPPFRITNGGNNNQQQWHFTHILMIHVWTRFFFSVIWAFFFFLFRKLFFESPLVVEATWCICVDPNPLKAKTS